MNTNQMNEEHLPKPQETKKKNSRFTFVKLSVVVMFASVCVVSCMAGNGMMSDSMFMPLLIAALAGTYLFIGIFAFIRYKRTHKKK